jgi:hypothetical protein
VDVERGWVVESRNNTKGRMPLFKRNLERTRDALDDNVARD